LQSESRSFLKGEVNHTPSTVTHPKIKEKIPTETLKKQPEAYLETLGSFDF